MECDSTYILLYTQREENLSAPGRCKGVCKSCRDFQQKYLQILQEVFLLSWSILPQMHGYWPGLTRMQNRPSCVALTRKITNISLLQLLSPLNLHEILPLESHSFCFKALYLQKFLMENETFPWLTCKVISSPTHN